MCVQRESGQDSVTINCHIKRLQICYMYYRCKLIKPASVVVKFLLSKAIDFSTFVTFMKIIYIFLTFHSKGIFYRLIIEIVGFFVHTEEFFPGNFSFGCLQKFRSNTIVDFIDSAVAHSRSGRYLFFLHRRPILGPMRVQLLHPVSRFKQVQSLQHMCR